MRTLHYVPAQGRDLRPLQRVHRLQDPPADQRRLALARRPAERRPGRVGRAGRHRRPLRHRRGARRRLPADLVGRGAEQPARAPERHRPWRRDGRPRCAADVGLVDGVLRLRLQRQEPQRRQGRRRERHLELHPDPAQARQLADGPRPEHCHDRCQRLLQLRGCVPAGRVRLDGDGGVQRLVLHDRHHLPGRQPADPDDPQGRRCRREHAEHHRPRSAPWTGASTPTTRRGANGTDPRNGGIVGSISYDTTRNELDPQYAASEDWQPGVPDVPVKLYTTVDCGTNPGAPCDANDLYELAPDGSYKKGQLLNTYLSENWERPTGCTARDVDGVPLVHGVDEDHLAPNQETAASASRPSSRACRSAPTPPTR